MPPWSPSWASSAWPRCTRRPGKAGLLGTTLRPAWAGARAAGTAVTVLCGPGDNLMVHVAVEQARPGDLLVVTTTSPSSDGFIGELIVTSLAARGVHRPGHHHRGA